MMELRILLNGVLPDNQPIDIEKLSEKYGMNSDFRLFTREVYGDVIFYGTDYVNLYNQLRNNPCGVIDVELQEIQNTDGDWDLLYRGKIFINDIDFDIDKHQARVSLTDNGFTSLILRNADIKLDMNIGVTKNGSNNPAKIFDNIGIRPMNDATIVPYKTISIYNALDFAIRFCSDNNLSFYSQYLLSNPDNLNDLYLMSGVGLRTNTSVAPNNISTRQLFMDCTKLLGLYGFVETLPNGSTRIRYEDYSYFTNLPNGDVFDRFNKFEISVNDDAFFQTINFGSAVSKFSAYMTGWVNQETYAGSSDCNKQNTIDLTMQELITDSVVLDEIINGDDTYDENTCVIHDQSLMFTIGLGYDPSNTSNAPAYYNWMIRNIMQLNRCSVQYCLGEPNFKPLCGGDFYVTTDQILTPHPSNLSPIFWDTWETDCLYYNPINPTPPPAFTDFVIYLQNYPNINNIFSDGSVNTLYRIEYNLIMDIPARGPYKIYINFEEQLPLDVGSVISIIQDDPLGVWSPGIPILAKPGYNKYLTLDNTGGSPITGNVVSGYIDAVLTGYTGYNGALISALSVVFQMPLLGGSDITIKNGSYIKVRNIVSEEINIQPCSSFLYNMTANGYIGKDKAKNLRQNPLNFQTLLHRDNGYTGQIKQLDRRLMSGQSTINLNLKQI